VTPTRGHLFEVPRSRELSSIRCRTAAPPTRQRLDLGLEYLLVLDREVAAHAEVVENARVLRVDTTSNEVRLPQQAIGTGSS